MTRPLIDIAEGRDQDDRSDLLAAFRVIAGRQKRRESSNLHVREFLTYVLRVDRDGKGVQMSYDDIANLLDCERSMARSTVRRAEQIFGLLATFESRNVRGGQTPNRYSIDMAVVRSTLYHRAGIGLHTADPDSADTSRQHMDTDSMAGQALEVDPDSTQGDHHAHPDCVGDSRGTDASGHRMDPDSMVVQAVEADPDSAQRDPHTHTDCVGDLAGTDRGPSAGGPPGVSQIHLGVLSKQGPVCSGQGPVTQVHPYKEHTLPLALSLSAAAEAAAAGFEEFSEERRADLRRRASSLLRELDKRFKHLAISREFVWDVCAGAELLEQGLAAEWITRIAAGDVRKPRAFLDKCMRDECQRRQLDWPSLRKHIPRPGPEQARFDSHH